MGPGADASRCHADLARTGFRVGDEFGNGLGRYRRIHHDHTGKADEAREQMLLALVPDPLWWSVGDPHPDSGETSLELSFRAGAPTDGAPFGVGQHILGRDR